MSIDQLDYTLAIIPTVLIPLTMISVGISIVASFIAALFGVELKTEGPKRLLEVLLKPKVIFTAVIFNLAVYGASKLYMYEAARPTPIFIMKWFEKPVPSEKVYEDRYSNPYTIVLKKTEPLKFSPPKKVWSAKLKKGGFRPPTLSGGSIFAASFDSHVYELNAQTGEQIRKFKLGAPASIETSIKDGLLYIGEGVHETHHARIYQFSLKSGELVKTFETLGHIEAQAEIGSYKGQEYLITSSGKGGIYALKLPSLELKWNTNVGHCDAPPLLSDGVVYTSTGREKHNPDLFRSYAAAVSLEDGNVIWKKELPVSSWYQPILHDDEVCFVLGEVYFNMDYGGVTCFNKDTGTATKTMRMDGPVVSAPLVAKDFIFIASSYGEVCKWSLSTAKRQWCKSFQSKKRGFSYTNLMYDFNKNWLVYPYKDKVYILSPETGEELAIWQPEEKVLPTYSTIVLEGEDWILYSKRGLIGRYRF